MGLYCESVCWAQELSKIQTRTGTVSGTYRWKKGEIDRNQKLAGFINSRFVNFHLRFVNSINKTWENRGDTPFYKLPDLHTTILETIADYIRGLNVGFFESIWDFLSILFFVDFMFRVQLHGPFGRLKRVNVVIELDLFVTGEINPQSEFIFHNW